MFKEKYNEGCLKIFKLIFLLYEDKAYYKDVLKIFDTQDKEQQHVILNKYLNTLKIFGIKVEKKNNKYIMHNIPFAPSFSIEDLKSIAILESSMNKLPDGKLKSDISGLINDIKQRFSDNTIIQYNSITTTGKTGCDFLYSNIKNQIEKCEIYCQEQYKINIRYKTKNGKEVSSVCNAKQVIYGSKTAFLRIYKIKEQEVTDIPIENILSVTQLPVLKNNTELPMTIVFRLKGRLAKAYTLKENERIIEVKEDGSIVVANNNEPYESLLNRLSRYDYDCIIERPKFFKEKMIERINDSLKNYE